MRMTAGSERVWLAMAVTLAGASGVQGQTPDAAAAETMRDRMVEAYRQAEQYRATVRYERVVDDGRRERAQWATFEVAYEQEGPKLRLDRPQALLVADGDQLRLKVEGLAARYLETPQPSPLNYAAVSGLLPALEEPVLPDVAMLLSRDPLVPIAGWWQPELVAATSAEASDDGRARLEVRTRRGLMTFELDPETYLIQRVVLEMDAAAVGLPPGGSARDVFVFEIESHDEPLPAEAFAFDPPPGAQAAASVQAMFTGMIPEQEEPAHPLVGRQAPSFRFTTEGGQEQSVEEIDAEVVLLDFWATWCMPCRVWMPQLSEIQRWADAEGKSVQIVGVSVDEDQAAARRYWQEHDYDLMLAEPVDAAAVQRAYQAYQPDASGNLMPMGGIPLPYTVVLHHGEVVDIHMGVGPQMRDKVQAQIEALLSGGDAGE